MTFGRNMKTIKSVSRPWWMESKRFNFIATILAILLGVTIYLAFKSDAKAFDKLAFAVTAILTSAGALSMLLSFQQMHFTIHREGIKGTYEFLARYNTERFREQRSTVRSLFKVTGDLKECLHDQISQERKKGFLSAMKPEHEEAAASLMSFFEDMALGIRAGYIDEVSAYRSLGPVTILYINGLRPYIENLQKERGDTIYYEDALLLLRHWKDSKSFTE